MLYYTVFLHHKNTDLCNAMSTGTVPNLLNIFSFKPTGLWFSWSRAPWQIATHRFNFDTHHPTSFVLSFKSLTNVAMNSIYGQRMWLGESSTRPIPNIRCRTRSEVRINEDKAATSLITDCAISAFILPPSLSAASSGRHAESAGFDVNLFTNFCILKEMWINAAVESDSRQTNRCINKPGAAKCMYGVLPYRWRGVQSGW